jgi:hypothetical protein
VEEAFRREFKTTRDERVLAVTSARLAQEPQDKTRELFLATLERNDSPGHTRIAARVVSCFHDLTPAVRVRVSVFIEGADFPVPAVDASTVSAWTLELEGPRAHRAQSLVESLGESAFLQLLGGWDSLGPATRGWLLHWGVRDHLGHVTKPLLSALRTDTDRTAALGALAGLAYGKEPFESSLSELAKNEDAVVRLAALKAGARVEEPGRLAQEEPDPEIRRHFVDRMTDASRLAEILEDPVWQVRAAAVRALIRCGDSAEPVVAPLLHSDQEEIRVAAIQVLLGLGRQEVVTRHIPGQS